VTYFLCLPQANLGLPMVIKESRGVGFHATNTSDKMILLSMHKIHHV